MYVMDSDWKKLLDSAKAVLKVRRISEWVETGSVAAAILTDRKHIYTGVCIDSACSLGMCAERNAAACMLTHGEHSVLKMLCINKDGIFLPPCGACREFLMELDPQKNAELEVMLGEEHIVRLRDLLPEWWGWKKG